MYKFKLKYVDPDVDEDTVSRVVYGNTLRFTVLEADGTFVDQSEYELDELLDMLTELECWDDGTYDQPREPFDPAGGAAA